MAEEPVDKPAAYDVTGDFKITGSLGVGIDPPSFRIHAKDLSTRCVLRLDGNDTGTGSGEINFADNGANIARILASSKYGYVGFIGTGDILFRVSTGNGGGGTSQRLNITGGVDTASATFEHCRVGINTDNATDRLTVQGTSGNLIACYPGDSRAAGAAVFRVESDGDVYADGTVYSYDTAAGGADVAERINVSEWVESGDVVEIDPEHVGFFRKATGAYSRRVAGIISTSPGVILGNDVDPKTDAWDDGRPVLAIAGRVPVKASTENGPIEVGDLLVSSSVPGVAMKGDPAVSIGAVVGKAMEPLKSGDGIVMAQVTLR